MLQAFSVNPCVCVPPMWSVFVTNFASCMIVCVCVYNYKYVETHYLIYVLEIGSPLRLVTHAHTVTCRRPHIDMLSNTHTHTHTNFGINL